MNTQISPMTHDNPLLQPFTTPFGVPPFHQIALQHYLPAVEFLIEKAQKQIDAIVGQRAEPTFENTVVALERSGEHLNQVAETFFNLNAAETSTERQEIAAQIAPQLTAFANETMQNARLFARIQSVYERKDTLTLDREDERLLQKTYRDFARSGAHLNAEEKEKYNTLSMALAKASLKFGENVLAETNRYALVVEDEADLSGLPESAVEAAAQAAREKGHEGAWVFTLHAPSFIPFMEYADNRALRAQLYKAYMSRAFKGDDFDNQALVKEIVVLRYELAKCLGYETYADYVLEERMAETPQKVMAFLRELLEKALPKARQEVEELKAFIQKQGDDITLERWDWAYYSRKLKQAKYDLDDEMLRPYFRLENVVQGAFEVVRRLYGLSFVKKDLPAYHPQVEAYEVLDASKNHVAVCYMDFFPRPSKQGGAWMTTYRGQWKDQTDHRPIVSIVCNFTPPTESKPSLLTFPEVETFFHELGHALHGILSEGKYSSLSGTQVYWDFVELPSQLLENWAKEKACLDLFAQDYQTGALIPDSLVQKIKATAQYHAAYQTLRQISFGLVDMAWHTLRGEQASQVDAVLGFETQAMQSTELLPPVEGACMSTQFSHIFQGGYAAGYYSYKWAEVLDADAFSVFKKRGIFDPDTAHAFKEHILSKGGSEHPMTLYQRFRGQAPTLDPPLERSGLKP